MSGCSYGIYGTFSAGLNVIGNTVDAASGTTGINLTDDYSTLLDQNTVTGDRHPLQRYLTKVYRRNNY